MIIWICGLSGSGKSTIANEVVRLLRDSGRPTVVVDGDSVRNMVRSSNEPDQYAMDGRRRNAERIDSIVEWLDSQGLDVVVAVQSIFPEILESHREVFREYFEVHLDASLDLVQRRDPKGVHSRAQALGGHETVGYGIPYKRPHSSDLYIDMDHEQRSPSELATHIVDAATARLAQVGIYPYASGNLLTQPHTYFYSSGGGLRFLKAYLQQRLGMISLHTHAYTGRATTVITPSSNWVLVSWHRWLEGDDDAIPEVMETLLKRFAVTKKIWSDYGADVRPTDTATDKDPGLYLAFYGLSLRVFRRSQDARFLNMALQLGDILCAEHRALSSAQTSDLFTWLLKEVEAVLELHATRVRE